MEGSSSRVILFYFCVVNGYMVAIAEASFSACESFWKYAAKKMYSTSTFLSSSAIAGEINVVIEDIGGVRIFLGARKGGYSGAFPENRCRPHL